MPALKRMVTIMWEKTVKLSLTPRRQNPTHAWARIIQHMHTVGICFHLRWRCSVQSLTSVKAATAKPVLHPGAEA